jgi:hypothetical protein
MQNKANLRKSQMNVNICLTKDYENKSNWTLGKNKPNSKPIKANFRQEMPKMPYLPACVKRHYAGTVKAMQPGTFFWGLIDDVRIYDRATSMLEESSFLENLCENIYAYLCGTPSPIDSAPVVP